MQCLASPCPIPSSISRKSSILHPWVSIAGTRTELVETEKEDGLVDLEAQDGGLDEAQGLAVDLDEALAGLAVCDGGGGLLLAEALDGLNGRHFCGCLTGRGVESRFGRGGRRWAGRRWARSSRFAGSTNSLSAQFRGCLARLLPRPQRAASTAPALRDMLYKVQYIYM